MIGVYFAVFINNKMSIEVKVEISIITYRVCLMEMLFSSRSQHQCSTKWITSPSWGLSWSYEELVVSIEEVTHAIEKLDLKVSLITLTNRTYSVNNML